MKTSGKKNKLAINLKVVFAKTMLGMAITTITAVAPSVIAQEKTTRINFDLGAAPTNAKILHIPGGNRIVAEFDVSRDLTNKLFIDNPYVLSLSSQYSDGKLRMLIETRVPVKFGIEYKGRQGTIVLAQNNIFEEFKGSENIKEITTVTSVTKTIETTPTPIKVVPLITSTQNSGFVQSVTPLQQNKIEQRTDLEGLNIKAEGSIAKLTLDIDGKKEPIFTKNGNLLIIDLPQVNIDNTFQKSIPVSHLGTQVKSLDVTTQRGNGRIILSQHTDQWEYSSYQTDKKTVIEIKSTEVKVKEQAYTGKPLTLNFQNMDVRAILQVIADFTGLNIVASDSVAGSMTVRLKDVPWDQALDLVLEARNLHKQKNGNVVWVATRQEITEKNKAQIELKEQNSTLAPLIVRFFQLNHYKAQEMKAILEQSDKKGSGSSEGSKGTFLSGRGSVGLDVRNNTIFVQDTEDNIEEVARIVKRLDQASKQVLIEAKLVVVDDKYGKELGSKFGVSWNKQNGSTGVGVGGSLSGSQGLAGNGSPGSSLGDVSGGNWNSGVSGGGAIGFTILNGVLGNALSFELSALEENNRGKVISNPRLLTTNNKKAEIKQGTEIPYVTPGANNSPATVEFKSAALKLGVTPQVSANGRVTMDLDISKDTIGQLVNVQGGGQVPSIYTRQMTTQVTVNDGQTVVLGGIYEVTNREDISKVPLFGDIPWIGNLFKHKTNGVEKVELLVFITPKVINEEDLDNLTANETQSSNEIDIRKK